MVQDAGKTLHAGTFKPLNLPERPVDLGPKGYDFQGSHGKTLVSPVLLMILWNTLNCTAIVIIHFMTERLHSKN